jgi:hypothetical protein
MIRFTEFVDRKKRQAKKHLKIIKKMLESLNYKISDQLTSEDDPYIFVYSPAKNHWFDGIRIYQIGECIAFRIQKQEKTQPFGQAYSLDIEGMFEDFISEYNPEEAGKKVVEAVNDELKNFFKKSVEAEKDITSQEFDAQPYNWVIVKSNDYGIDYSTLIYMKS